MSQSRSRRITDFLRCRLLARHHTAKTKMIRAGVHFAFAARADDVTGAVLVVAKEGAAAMNAFWLVRFSWVERRSRPLWIHFHAACFGQLRGVTTAVPIAAPLPNVDRH